MSENGKPNEGWSDRRHDLWLAMQAAYKRYISASTPLDELEEFGAQDRLIQRQRTAFEKYIDARLQFSESLLPRYAAQTATGQPGKTASPSWMEVFNSKLAVPCLAGAVLCLTALSLVLIIRAQRQFRDLDDASRNQTRSGVPAPGAHSSKTVQQITAKSGGGVPSVVLCAGLPAVIHDSHPAPVAPCCENQSQASLPQTKRRISYAQSVRAQGAQRIRYEFTLTFSPQYKSLGPFRASLQRIDWKHDTFDVSFWYGDFHIDKKHVRPDEPFWIRPGGWAKPFQLLINRIGPGYVHGYLCNYQCERQDLTPAPSQRTASLELSNRGDARFANP